jgi:hypothetical protein
MHDIVVRSQSVFSVPFFVKVFNAWRRACFNVNQALDFTGTSQKYSTFIFEITKISASRFAPSNPTATIKLPFAADKDKKRYTHIKQIPMFVIPRALDVVE